MLMGAHNRTVDHRIFVVGVCCEMLKHPPPDTALGPTAEPPVHLNSVTEPLRQIAPWHPGTITIVHGLDEQPIVRRGHPDRTLASGQQVLDPFPLILAQSESPHHRSASNKLTAYESKKLPRRNRLCSTRRRLTVECGNCDSPAKPHSVRAAPTSRNRLIDDRA
jgi:hypothetical protein